MSTKQRPVIIIDPSSFTVPYDSHLAEGISGASDGPVQIFCKYGTRSERPRTTLAPFFYRRHEALRKRRWVPAKLGLLFKGLEHIYDSLRLAKTLIHLNPRAVHYQWLPVPLIDTLVIRFLRPRLRAPLILTVHDTLGLHHPSSRLQLFGWKKSLSLFDLLIVHDEKGAQCLYAAGISRDRVRVISHGLLNHPATPEPADSRPAADPLKILMFGNVKPYKGLDLLFRAFGQLPADLRQKAVLQIVGRAFIDLKPLVALAEELAIQDQILWETRFVEAEEVDGIFKAASIVVLPYRKIDASGVLMSCLPYLKPIIASRVGTFPSLVHDGVNGWTFEPGDHNALGELLARMIRDPRLRSELGEGNRQILAGIPQWHDIGRMTLQAYGEAGRRRPGPEPCPP